MQLFAFDKKNQLIFALHAKKGENYVCAECGCRVRLRGGLHRKNHYYHLEPNRTCRQSQKSLEHIQIQSILYDMIPSGDCFLERRFDAIGRIADVVWESKKIIFEVQCSPITAAEVRERNRDYAKEGYQVVWILHDHRFNKWRVTAAEYFLWNLPHYFTNIDVNGVGMIYDQIDVLKGGTRRKIESYFPVNLSAFRGEGVESDFRGKGGEFDFGGVCGESENESEIVDYKINRKIEMPKILEEKREGWGLGFSGDVIDLLGAGGSEGGGSGGESECGEGLGKGSVGESERDRVGLGGNDVQSKDNERFWRAISELLELQNCPVIDSWGDWVKSRMKTMIYRWVVRPYLIWFQIALERHCR